MAESKIKTRFGKRLKQLRRERNLTQEMLAHKTGLHVTYISVVERGIKNISLESMEKIINALRVSMAEFFAPFK